MTPEEKQRRLASRLIPEMQAFRDQCQTLQLATLTERGLPTASYAPFAFDETGFYILVSDIAPHGANLRQNKALSIMMIEGENEAKQLFARQRLSFETQALEIERTSHDWGKGVDALTARFGEIIDNLSSLGDFRLYRLMPEQGRYVKGFGQAFDVTGFEMVDIVHLDEGHIKQKA